MAAGMNFFGNALAAFRARWVRAVLALFLASFTAGLSVSAIAQQENPSPSALERGVKAAFLYKFLGFIEWPPAAFSKADTPLTIGIIGADTVAAELAQIAQGRTVNNRKVIVKKISNGEPLSEFHMLFIGRGESARQGQLLKAAHHYPIVTVTETEGALEQGSMINFRVAEGRVRFEISLVAAERTDLKLSSRMLAVASSVHTVSRQ